MNPDFEVIAKLESVKKAVDWLKNNKADLIFLDIHLADGISFRIFDEIEIKTPIIFTTAFDQYAIQAFKVNSIDYLLKPINKFDLAQSIEKFQELYQSGSGESPVDYSGLMEIIGDMRQKKYQKTIYGG